MHREAVARGIALAVIAFSIGCGGGPESVDTTVATLRTVRSEARSGEDVAGALARVMPGEVIASGEASLAQLELDSGPSVLVDQSSRLTVSADDALELTSGRAYVQAHAGDALTITLASTTLRAADAALSIAASDAGARIYVVRGEVSWRAGDARGVAHAGEELALSGDAAPSITPATLWSDWTGGLVRPGPESSSVAPGMGTLEARVPDEIGLARWALTIRRLDVRVRIEGDLAITEVEQEFFNPASETVEGLYRVSVPEGAVLQRFAVDRNGAMVDGYVREQQQARAAYEAQVYRGSTDDPALLEWDSSGRYRARIYPIAPGEVRRIAIRYAEWLTRAREGGPRLYRYPMAGGERAPHVQEMAFVADIGRAGASRVRAGMGAVVEQDSVVLRRSDFRPRADLWLELFDTGTDTTQRAYRATHEPPPRAPDSRAIVHEADERDYWYLPLHLPESIGERARAAGIDLVVVADVSAATDRSHLELGRSVVESIAAHLGPNDRISVVGADLAIRPLVTGDDATALGAADPARLDALLEGLSRVPAGGASDLGAAIAEAAELLDPTRPGAVIYVGDGAPTVGELGAEELIEHLARLPNPVRLYGVAVGADARLDLLDALTHGGGLALRVEERGDAAEAALRVLAHVGRPLLARVTVDVGAGIDNVFPRRPVDVALGDVLSIVGRVRDTPPTEVIVRGEVAGEPFEERIAVRAEIQSERTDLRLRWAGERLRQLLLEGATREEIAELGTRYGLITPYTSYYVPSARELREMGTLSQLLIHRPLVDPTALASSERSIGQLAIAIALGPLSLSGCADRDVEPAVTQAPTGASNGAGGAPVPPAVVETTTTSTPTVQAGRYAIADAPASGAAAVAPSPMPDQAPMPSAAAPYDSAPAAEPMPVEAAGMIGGGSGGSGDGYGMGPARATRSRASASPVIERAARGRANAGSPTVSGAIAQASIESTVRSRMGAIRACYERELRNDPTLAGTVAIDLTIGPGGEVTRASVASSSVGGPVGACVASVLRGIRFPAGGSTATVRYPFTFSPEGGARKQLVPETITRVTTTVITTTTTASDHARHRCSDAASLSLDDRRALWRERLERAPYVGPWVDVYRAAIRDCEAPAWRDRRALQQLLLARAGTLAGMIEVYRNMIEGSARGYLRGEILRRVRSPEDLRMVRQAFGLSGGVDWALVEQVLTRAITPLARVRALRELVRQTPDSFDLKLRLLEELEAQHRMPEALRLAESMRRDPLADPGTRTAIGEMYFRLDRIDDARRAFSEIVEFAPLDELARRRLGDLYRAHGWHEDAYRQYATLAQIRPDDPGVMLLLAQAAAGAGRTDEALRLEQRLMETAEPGAREGLGRVAQLWSSVRFAKLREDARRADDDARLDQLGSRMRRSGVLRGAGDLRVSLTWAHPDAQLSLWTAHPGLSPTRPEDLAPELGIEAFDVAEQQEGVYRIEVRRSSRDRLGAIEGELLVVWREGREDERIEIVPLRFDGEHRALGWTITGTTLRASDVP